MTVSPTPPEGEASRTEGGPPCAGSSESTVTPKPQPWPTCRSMPCSTAGRSRRASSPRTERAAPSRRDGPGGGRLLQRPPDGASRPRGHRTRPLLHRRRLPRGKPAAAVLPPPPRSDRDRPQRQPGERRSAAEGAGGGGLHLPDHRGHGGDPPSHRPIPARRRGRRPGGGPAPHPRGIQPGHDGRRPPDRRAGSPRFPAPLPGAGGRRLGRRQRDLRLRPDRCASRARSGTGRGAGHLGRGGCAPASRSIRRRRRPAFSSRSTSPARTAGWRGTRSRPPANGWARSCSRSIRPTSTWWCPCRTPACPPPSVSPRPPASPSTWGWSETTTWAAPSLSPRSRSATSACGSSSTRCAA